MRTKIFIISLLFSTSTCLFGQVNIIDSISDEAKTAMSKGMELLYQSKPPDSLNRVDRNGKKYGWQIDYLDKKWRIVTKEKSYYFMYSFYDKGFTYAPVIDYIKNCTLKTESNAVSPKLGEPEALNGKYTWYDKDGTVASESQFRDGYRTGTHKVYKKGKIYFEPDFDKKYDKYQDYSYYFIKYKKDGSISDKGYYRHGNYKGKDGYYIFLE